MGQEVGVFEALVHLTCFHHEGVRQEAAGALWNLSFEDKNKRDVAHHIWRKTKVAGDEEEFAGF